MGKSSLLVSVTAIIAIFVVLMMVVTDIDQAPVRKPFSPNLFNKPAVEAIDNKETNLAKFTESDQYQKDFKEAEKTQNSAMTGTLTFDGGKIDWNPEIAIPNEGITTDKEKTTAIEPVKEGGINYQNLLAAGFADVVIQKSPVTDTIFENTPIPELEAYQPTHEIILAKINNSGLRGQIANVWKFQADDRQTLEEVYILIKAKFSGQLGIEVRENNQFGQKSFYVNFNENVGSQNDVFLVVKTLDSVYALSYVKDYHDLMKSVLKLI